MYQIHLVTPRNVVKMEMHISPMANGYESLFIFSFLKKDLRKREYIYVVLYESIILKSMYILQVGAIILYTYVFKMLAPPPGESFDGNEDDKQLPIIRSSPLENSNAAVEDNALVSNKSSIDNGAAPESEPLLNSSDETLTTTKRFSLKRVSYHLICYIFLLVDISKMNFYYL